MHEMLFQVVQVCISHSLIFNLLKNRISEAQVPAGGVYARPPSTLGGAPAQVRIFICFVVVIVFKL